MERIKKENNVGGWFEHFKEIDLPAERKKIREDGREEGIKIIIDTLKELNASYDFVSDKLIEKYSLTPEQAEEKLSKYW